MVHALRPSTRLRALAGPSGILHRLETCARAREESTRIMSFRFAQRDAVKEDTQRAAVRLVCMHLDQPQACFQ